MKDLEEGERKESDQSSRASIKIDMKEISKKEHRDVFVIQLNSLTNFILNILNLQLADLLLNLIYLK